MDGTDGLEDYIINALKINYNSPKVVVDDGFSFLVNENEEVDNDYYEDWQKDKLEEIRDVVYVLRSLESKEAEGSKWTTNFDQKLNEELNDPEQIMKAIETKMNHLDNLREVRFAIILVRLKLYQRFFEYYQKALEDILTKEEAQEIIEDMLDG